MFSKEWDEILDGVGSRGSGACPLRKPFKFVLVLSRWKCTNFLKDAHLGLLWKHSERRFSKMKLGNSRVNTYHEEECQCVINAHVGARAWDYIEMRETHAQCMRLESSTIIHISTKNYSSVDLALDLNHTQYWTEERGGGGGVTFKKSMHVGQNMNNSIMI